jgi:hypothetical protein
MHKRARGCSAGMCARGYLSWHLACLRRAAARRRRLLHRGRRRRRRRVRACELAVSARRGGRRVQASWSQSAIAFFTSLYLYS